MSRVERRAGDAGIVVTGRTKRSAPPISRRPEDHPPGVALPRGPTIAAPGAPTDWSILRTRHGPFGPPDGPFGPLVQGPVLADASGERPGDHDVILLLDDDPTSLRLLEMALLREGHKPVAFTDPVAALDLLKTTEEVIDLIVTDIRMPGINGLEFIRQIRARPATRFTPVLLCSGATDAGTVVAAISSGIRDYVVKPIDPAVVIRKVRAILSDFGPIIASRAELVSRLGLSDGDYGSLVEATIPHLDALIVECENAVAADEGDAVRDIASRMAEPAHVFQAGRVLAAADHIIRAAVGAPVIEPGRTMVREAMHFHAALRRAANLPVGGRPVRRP